VKAVRAKGDGALGSIHTWFAALLGGLLGLSLVKFGNPVILDRHVHRPETMLELIFNAWPISWGYAMALLVVALAPLVLITRPSSSPSSPCRLPNLFCFLPLLWLVWQGVATLATIDAHLSGVTMVHFTVCIALFYVGWFCLSGIQQLKPLAWGLLGGFLLMIWAGFDQRFGGLEATRQMLYETAVEYPPDFLRRIASDRIFGTMFYPNALAGVILLLAPLLIWFVNQQTARMSNIMRGTAIGLLGYGSVACLYWSQSKAGWLVAAVLVFIALLQLRASTKIRLSCALGITLFALIVFSFRFSDYFAHGAASASARMDYWQAAWITAQQNPVTGTGPGTFQIPYAALKRPESEMARLTHNDYLQQGSDGGWISMVLYTGFIFGSIAFLYPKARLQPVWFVVWLGLAGWALHSIVEFGLYIPALAWPAFTLLGWLWAVLAGGAQGAVSAPPTRDDHWV
jgi:O-antigen ligase